MNGINILFKKKTKKEIESSPIENGTVWFDTTDKSIFVDDNGTRTRYAGGNLSSSDLLKTIQDAQSSLTNKPVGSDIIKELMTIINSKPEIRRGKSDPDNSIGKDGDIYIKII